MSELLRLTREARANLQYDQALEPESNKIVNLNDVRGSFSEEKLLWELGVVEDDGGLDPLPERQYIVFGGHRGCGKSTALRQLNQDLHQPDRYFVVFIDALLEVDINNFGYSDILLAEAKVLLQKLEESGVQLDQIHLDRLERWFHDRVEVYDKTKEFSTQFKAGVKAQQGLPFLLKLFAEMTNSIRINATHKEELRNVVRNSFSEFAAAFNQLVQHAEEKIAAQNLGKQILFIVDGVDRLRGEDARNFFIHDVHQLKQIDANFIYCAPIHLLTESGGWLHAFHVVRLPMVKLTEKGEETLAPDAREKLQDLVYRRVDKALFAEVAVLDYLIRYSGGHLRDLLRLLNFSFAETMGRKKIDQEVAEAAVRQLATEYRRVITENDYPLLREIDQKEKEYTPVTDDTRRLLYDLVLLEYNSYWWQSHPVVRTLTPYHPLAE